MSWEVRQAEALRALAQLDPESVDAVVTDPPYGIGFMGREWDGKAIHAAAEADRARRKDLGGHSPTRPGRAEPRSSSAFGNEAILAGPVKGGRAYQEWCERWAAECLRILKPGGHLLSFGGTRTYHRLATGVEDAGFEIRDALIWLYGSGFPKSLNVGKAIDGTLGAEREVVETIPDRWQGKGDVYRRAEQANGDTVDVTAHASAEAQAWDDWGTALKPSHEPVVVARKSLTGTVAGNVLAHGTGAINIGATRLAVSDVDRDNVDGREWVAPEDRVAYSGFESDGTRKAIEYHDGGRWPANVALSHLPECEQIGVRRVKTNMATSGESQDGQIFGFGNDRGGEPRGHADDDGTETVPAYRCAQGCPVAELDRQSGELRSPGNLGGTDRLGGGYMGGWAGTEMPTSYGDRGGASRFFYTAKASRAERNAGLDDFPEQAGPSEAYGTKAQHPLKPEGEPNIVLPVRNAHPTVKPIDLMRWLVRMVTPPGGLVLDPFTGSGTTGVAAVLEGMSFIGIEREPEYVPIAKARLAWWEKFRGRDTAEALGLGLASDAARREHAEAGQMGLL